MNETGLYLPTQAKGIANGSISLVMKTKRIAVKDRTFVLCDDNTAYGDISFTTAPQKLNLPAFKNMVGKHGITEDARKINMPKRRTFYAYGFTYTPFTKQKPASGEIVNDTFIPELSYTELDESKFPAKVNIIR